MKLRQLVSEELLPFVRQPGQYIGGEVNQLVRPGDWQRADVRVAVAFPDAYTIDTSNVGRRLPGGALRRVVGTAGRARSREVDDP